jgi:hypothetical protein
MKEIKAYKSDDGKIYYTPEEAINADKNKKLYNSLSVLVTNNVRDDDNETFDFLLDNAEELYKILKERFED